MAAYYKSKKLKLNIKHYAVLLIVLIIGCSHNNLSKQSKSEMDIYKESFEIPIDILNKNTKYIEKSENNKNYKTWVAEYFDKDKTLIGEHYIYWDIENNFMPEKMLEPIE